MNSINEHLTKYSNVSFGRNVWIGQYCVIGCPKEESIRRHITEGKALVENAAPVRISDGCIISNHVCIREGTEISAGTVVEDYARIGYNCKIGRNVRIMYGSYICDGVTIADNARIAGFICDGTQIGERSTVMGDLVHEYSKPHLSWWDVEEPPPIIENDVVIGFRAIVIGGIRISSQVYVAAGAIVTKDVPPKCIVRGINERIPIGRWPGSRLAGLIRFWSDPSRINQ